MKKVKSTKFIVLILLLAMIFSCSTENPQGYSINANIEKLADSKVYLMTSGEYLGYTFEKVDSTNSINGIFEFSGKVNYPEMYYLSIGNNIPIPFYIENSQIKINGSSDDIENTSVTGSTLDTEIRKAKSQIDELKTDNEKKSFILSYINRNKNSFLNPYLILNYIYNLSTHDELVNYYSLMDRNVYEHRYSKRINNQIKILEAVQVGKIAPNFIEKDTLGNNISLSSFKGKYLLIDFWASWCGPCRAENPAMVSLYKDLKTKNVEFEILGVAADFTESRWKKALIKDNLPWKNVSDIKGLDGSALQLFGVKSLPYTVLIDPDGRIIEKGLTGEDVRKKIKEITLSK